MVIRRVLNRPEQGFGVGVVLADPWPGERPEHVQLFLPIVQRGRTHGVAVVGMENQGLTAPLADPLLEASPADQIVCDGWVCRNPCPAPF